mmetsp:Transcript_2245/g.3964  ORF Transcript_2245/g.3964 Transcript_2245/m.3964 type:complete len:211 (+) Transcript_2245:1827-2459(+)
MHLPKVEPTFEAQREGLVKWRGGTGRSCEQHRGQHLGGLGFECRPVFLGGNAVKVLRQGCFEGLCNSGGCVSTGVVLRQLGDLAGVGVAGALSGEELHCGEALHAVAPAQLGLRVAVHGAHHGDTLQALGNFGIFGRQFLAMATPGRIEFHHGDSITVEDFLGEVFGGENRHVPALFVEPSGEVEKRRGQREQRQRTSACLGRYHNMQVR